MRIQVKSKDANLDIPLPTSMLVSPMVSRIVLKVVRKEGRDLSWLTPELVEGLQKTLKSWIRRNGHFMLVEVESADGEIVKIKL